MSVTLPNITLPAGVWVNAYAALGLTVGTPVEIYNLGSSDYYVSKVLAMPPINYEAYVTLKPRNEPLPIHSGAVGLWVLSPYQDGKINIGGLDDSVLSVDLPRTAFGELSVAEPTPVVQMAANYGIGDKAFVFTVGTGNVLAEDSMFKARTGASSGAFSSLLTKKQLVYRPGQGAEARFTALFTQGVVGNQQISGLITATDSLAFGYTDDDFGIVYSHSGKVELQTLEITTPAGGSENATIVIDGGAYIVPLTSGTVQHNAFEISESLNAQVLMYSFSSNDNSVISLPVLSGPAVIPYTFSSATAVAVWSQNVAGVTSNDEFIPQADWNRNTFPTLDPTQGNVYQIKFQYLGFGGLSFFIENPVTTDFDLVHTIEYANNHIVTSVTNPSFRVGWATTNTTNNTDIEISGASVAGFVEGKVIISEDPRSLDVEVLNVGVAAPINMITIRNRLVFGLQTNRAPIIAIKVTGLTESAKGAILRVVKNAAISGDLDYQYVDKELSVTEFATDNGIVVGGTVISSVAVTTSGVEVDLSLLDVDLLPGDTITVSMRTISASASDAAATISFREDV